jgi:hypothetical protein
MKSYRVIQWATGSIGQISIQSFVRNPQFELVGCYVTSAAKVGRDAGELAGIDPIGVIATNNVDEILAMDADCVHYAPLYVDLDAMCRILESGKNLVTPAGFVFADSTRPDEVERLRTACKEGNTSLHGTGIHPGFSGDLLPITMARLSFSIEQIIVQELADLRRHPSKQMIFDGLGFGRDPDAALANPSPLVLTMDNIFRESQMMVAAALGLEVDEYTHEYDVAVTKRRVEIRSGVIEQGTIGGARFEWTAWSDGKPRIVFRSFWKTDDDLEPDWDLKHLKYQLIIEGMPSVKVTLEPAASHTGRDVEETDDVGVYGRYWTAMNGVNAIPAVCEAPPGIRTHLDLPFVQPKGLFD